MDKQVFFALQQFHKLVFERLWTEDKGKRETHVIETRKNEEKKETTDEQNP